MGWNTVRVVKENPLIPSAGGEQRYYFVHSYHVACRDESDVLATTSHGYEVTAALSRENIMGVQFHPEKSHRFGMALMRRFVELPC
jgi:glutamine amidotransferase